VLIKTPEQIKKIRNAGKILANTIAELRKVIKEGITLRELDVIAKSSIEEAGAKPAFLGYRPHGAKRAYPASICASLNEVVVHGLPGNYKLKSGDIISVDLGVDYGGGIADAAFSVGIGDISDEARRLLDVTQNSLLVGIKECRPNRTVGDIGWAINNYVTKNNFKVVKGLTGHGVGDQLHEEPSIFNEGNKNTGLKIKAGMVFAIEPMVSAGDPYLIQLPDDSYATRDGSLTGHFEHTVLITENGPEILTK